MGWAVYRMKDWEWKLSAVGLLVLGAVCCLQTGIFFASDVYPVVLGLSMLSLVLGLSVLIRRNKVWKYGSGFPDSLVLVSPFLMMTLYGVHGLLQPLSMEGTFVELLKWGWVGTFIVIAYYVGHKKEGRSLLRLGWHGMGLLLSLSSILDIYGLINVPYNIVYTSNLGISATGARLAGMLQYPNTFGAIMAAFLLERVFALAPLAQRRLSTLRVLLGMLPLAPYTAALLLSESRGAWLAAGVATAAGLVLERRRLAPPLMLAAAPCLGAALLYRQLAHVQLAPALWPSLLWLAGLWAGGVLAGLGLWRLWHRHQHARFTARVNAATHRREHARSAARVNADTHPRIPMVTTFLLVTGLWCASGVTVWFTVQERLTANFGTVSARWIMYRDAWKFIQQAPWLGQGGYTWRMSYPTIQSQPYVGSEVHSGYLDILLNTGWIGLMIVVFMLTGITWILYKRNRTLLPPFLILVFHATIDFDWSYGLVWLLIFWLAARGCSYRTNVEHNTFLYVDTLITQPGWKKVSPRLICTLWLCTMLSLGGISLRGEVGSILHVNALESKDVQSSERMLRSSLGWNPLSTETALDLVQIVPPEDRIAILTQSLSYAPQHPGLVWKLAYAYGELGESEKFVRWLAISHHLDPFNTNKQSQSLEQLLSLSSDQMNLGNREESLRLIYVGASNYKKYKQMVEALERQHEQLHNDRKFVLTREAELWGRQLDRLSQLLPHASDLNR